jgi:hypothetical protein
MTNKYQTGIYHIHLFDKHGTKQKTLLEKRNFVKAKKRGKKKCLKPPYASFVVTKVLFNSQDNNDPWRPHEV